VPVVLVSSCTRSARTKELGPISGIVRLRSASERMPATISSPAACARMSANTAALVGAGLFEIGGVGAPTMAMVIIPSPWVTDDESVAPTVIPDCGDAYVGDWIKSIQFFAVTKLGVEKLNISDEPDGNSGVSEPFEDKALPKKDKKKLGLFDVEQIFVSVEETVADDDAGRDELMSSEIPETPRNPTYPAAMVLYPEIPPTRAIVMLAADNVVDRMVESNVKQEVCPPEFTGTFLMADHI
jgi:hypothetical protein